MDNNSEATEDAKTRELAAVVEGLYDLAERDNSPAAKVFAVLLASGAATYGNESVSVEVRVDLEILDPDGAVVGTLEVQSPLNELLDLAWERSCTGELLTRMHDECDGLFIRSASLDPSVVVPAG